MVEDETDVKDNEFDPNILLRPLPSDSASVIRPLPIPELDARSPPPPPTTMIPPLVPIIDPSVSLNVQSFSWTSFFFSALKRRVGSFSGLSKPPKVSARLGKIGETKVSL